MMKLRTIGILLSMLALVPCWSAPPTAKPKVIANLSISADVISADDLREVFLQNQSSLQGSAHVQPVLERAGRTHETFLEMYLNRSDRALQMYYRSLLFTGKASMPRVFDTDAEVIAYVASTKGAIGYVSADAATTGVKTLTIK